MTKWLLLIWIQSNDSGFPNVEPAIVAATFETRAACVDAGPKASIKSLAEYHVITWACVEGGGVTEGKVSKHAY